MRSYPGAMPSEPQNVVLIGAHVRGDDPVAAAAGVDAQSVQLFLADPQGWKKPVPRDDADALAASGLGVYAHAPYLVNVASTNNRIRIPSRTMIAQHAAAAASLGARLAGGRHRVVPAHMGTDERHDPLPPSGPAPGPPSG